MAIKQTQQTLQTLPTNKVGQAFYVLKAGLALHIDDEREKLRSGDYDDYLVPYQFFDVVRLLEKMTATGGFDKLVCQVAVELDLDFGEEMFLWEGISLVVHASLGEEVTKRAVDFGMSRADRIELLNRFCRGRLRASEWESTYLETGVEKASFSTADPRSWL